MLPLQKIIQTANDSIPAARQGWGTIKSLSLEDFIDTVVSKMVHFAINVAIAVFVFYVGKFIIGKIYNLVSRIMTSRRVDKSLSTFLLSMVRILLYFILIVTVIGILGIETSSFIALFASAGVAIGMALSGTLQNFAGGVLILLLKPYKVGQYIETQNYAGTVTEIQIFSTIISTPDNKSIIIPNGPLSTSSINNWSRESYRRIDWNVSIAYGDDIAVAEKAILDILAEEPDVLKTNFATDRERRRSAQIAEGLPTDLDGDGEDDNDESEAAEAPRRNWIKRMLSRTRRRHAARIRAARISAIPDPMSKSEQEDRSPSVVLNNLGESSVDLKVRAWVPTGSYWTVYHKVYRRIYTDLGRPDSGIHFPFPQLDVHLTHGE